MKTVARLLIVLLAFGLTGCGPKRIDGNSEAAFKKSLEAMSKSLTAEDQKVLAESLMVVAMNGTNIFEAGAAPALFEQKARAELNGKTFAEIVARAKDIEAARAVAEATEKAEREKREAAAKAERKKQVEAEIRELSAEKTKAAADVDALKKFIVQRSRFYFADAGYRQEAVIELTVQNGLSGPVSRAYFKGRLTSPGRSIPWVDQTFNYPIRGGLEPGETVTWKLSPNMFSDWGKAPKDRNDMVLTVEVTQVDGADGKTLYDSDFSERKQKRLEELQASLSRGDY